MPRNQSTDARRARAAARSGVKYTRGLREQHTARAAQTLRHLEEASRATGEADCYVVAGAYDSRARGWQDLAELVRRAAAGRLKADRVVIEELYRRAAQACMLAAELDQRSASCQRIVAAHTPDDALAAGVIAELEARTIEPAREHVAGVAAALRKHGWTPYPPVPRTSNPTYARRYLRWERRWPNGTVISLYQDPSGFLSVHAKMSTDDPRWFCQIYGNNDGEQASAVDVAAAIAAYTERITHYDARLRSSP